MESQSFFTTAEDSPTKPTKIFILTNAYLNYKALDPRVISTGPIMECSPMRTHIIVQKQHEAEIVALLKAHPEIHCVNGDWTEFGRAEQDKMSSSFSGMIR